MTHGFGRVGTSIAILTLASCIYQLALAQAGREKTTVASHGVPYILRPIDKGEHGFAGGNPAQIEDGYNTMQEFILKYLEAK